ncbi:putative chitinase 1 [Biomphalaria glabrata]|uniref:Chitinase 1 n=1 Tax=Biomphalaria glabrata TaxID=6526 RepID=A0A9W2Z365_BIOGL|nr:putative chitinase 1 [Biomphalaria glabrata]
MMSGYIRLYFCVLLKVSILVRLIQGQIQQPVSSLQSFRRVCYFTNWSCDLLVKEAHFCLRHIDTRLCTHIVYAFAGINVTSLSLFPTRIDDETRGEIKGRYVLFNELKTHNKRLKTLLSVGGSYQTEMFVKVATSESARSQFAYNSAFYVRKWGFDGLDIDWEYPHETHKEALTSLIQDLKLAFLEEAELTGSPELLLSLAAPASDEKVKAGYQVNQISQHLDMINLMAYDFYGAWGRITGFNSPLYPRASDTRISHKHCVEWSVNLWLHLGAPAHKINLGIAAYGQSFTLDTKRGEVTRLNISATAEKNYLPVLETNTTEGNSALKNNNSELHSANMTKVGLDTRQVFGVGAKSTGPGRSGRLRHFNGQLSYPEICENSLFHNGRMFWDDEQQVPYVTYDDQWIGFDDVRSVAVKVKWAVRHRLGGIMFWSLDLDDFTGEYCGESRYPLLTAIHDTVTCLMDSTESNTTSNGSHDNCSGHYWAERNDSGHTKSLYQHLMAQSQDNQVNSELKNVSSVSQSRPRKGNTTRHGGSSTGSILLDKLRPNSTLHHEASPTHRANTTLGPNSHNKGHAGTVVQPGTKRQPPDGNGSHHRRKSSNGNNGNTGNKDMDSSDIPGNEKTSKELDYFAVVDSVGNEDLDHANDFNNYYYYIAFKADATVQPGATTSSTHQPTTSKSTSTSATTKPTTQRSITSTKKHSHKEKSGIPAHLRRNLSKNGATNIQSAFVLLLIFFFL